jgi:ribonuclease HI
LNHEPANDAVVAYIDGGARGNPGPAGYGVRVEQPDGTLVEEFSRSIGVATNNVAEYRGLLAALEWAKAHGCSRVHVRSDSKLLVEQMLGNYKVKHPGLQPLYGKARLLVVEIGQVTFEHVARDHNAHADRLANAAMDDALDVPTASGIVAQGFLSAEASAKAVSPAKHPFTDSERAVRLFVYRHFVETANAPDLATIARATAIADHDVAAALRKLADQHAIVLAPASVSVWMAHPFSAVPTPYPVDAGGRTYWANCAWDAAGMLSLIGDGETQTLCADCGQPAGFGVQDGALLGDGVVHFAVPPRRFWENVAYT